MLRRLPLLVLLLCSLVLAACGQEKFDPGGEQTENAQVAETEGISLDIEGAKYQVQLSRELNPGLPDDGPYLDNINAAESKLTGDQVWFAVFMRVENDDDERSRTAQTAQKFEIVDTQKNRYLPVLVSPRNEWSYQPTTLPPGDTYPGPNTPAGERTPNGAMLLFRIPRPSLDNRPLQLIITGRRGQRGIVDLDV